MLKTRNRLVNFRLTQDEYEKIQAALVAKGVRCLSDFARDAVLRYAESNGPAADTLEYRILDLDARVAGLETHVRQLRSLLMNDSRPGGDAETCLCPGSAGIDEQSH